MQVIWGGEHFCGDWRKESKLFAILADIYQRNCSNKFKITEIENKFDYIFKKMDQIKSLSEKTFALLTSMLKWYWI